MISPSVEINIRKKFKSKYGVQVHNFVRWRPYTDADGKFEFHPEMSMLQPDGDVINMHMEMTNGEMVYVRTIQQNMVSIKYRDGSSSVIDYTFLKPQERDRLLNNRTVGTL